MTELELLIVKSIIAILILMVVKLAANRAVNNILLKIDFDSKKKKDNAPNY